MAAPQELEFYYFDESPQTPIEVWLGLPVLALIFLAILILTAVFFFKLRNSDRSLLATYATVRLRQLKYLSALAILVSMTLWVKASIQAFFNAAIAGWGLDRVIGPFSEAMTFLLFGTFIASIGLVCMLLVLGRGRHAE